MRVTSSAFGVGADWEGEFIAEMAKGWRPYFDLLRLYLEHFPGQRVTFWEARGERKAEASVILDVMKRDLGVGAVGDAFSARGYEGRLVHVADDAVTVLASAPVPGFLAIALFDAGGEDGVIMLQIANWMFGDNADTVRTQEQPRWQAWLDALEVPA